MKATPEVVHTKLLPDVFSHWLLLTLSASLIRCTPEETVIRSTTESLSVEEEDVDGIDDSYEDFDDADLDESDEE